MERRCEHDGYGGILNPTSPDVEIDYPAFGHLCLKQTQRNVVEDHVSHRPGAGVAIADQRVT
jgi:hypothetical protein